MDYDTYLSYFTNGLSKEIKGNVILFTHENLNKAYVLAMLEDDKLAMAENNKLSFCVAIAQRHLGLLMICVCI